MKVLELLSADLDTQNKARKLYEDSFPEYERREWKTQLRASADPDSRSLLFLSDDNVFLGIMFYWHNGNMLYGEYFAVAPAFRGQNIGSEIISYMIRENQDKLFILEIDPPIDDISRRRLHFYERLGFIANPAYHYIHPSYATGEKAHAHELSIMSHVRGINQIEFDDFVSFMKKTVLKYIN